MENQKIEAPIEQRNTGKGNPSAIFILGIPLSNRQQRLLECLRNYDDVIVVKKNSVKMRDLAALTAKEGVEFALFTRQGERMVVRGNEYKVNINPEKAAKLNIEGWRWSGHTHPGSEELTLIASNSDMVILRLFKDQEQSSVYNSKGRYRVFDKE